MIACIYNIILTLTEHSYYTKATLFTTLFGLQVMRTKAQTSTKDTKEKTPGIGSRSRNRGFDSDYDVDVRDYDEDPTSANVTDVEPKKIRKGKKKFRRKSK